MTVAIVAKDCRPGHVKTRLCPPLTPAEAAAVAAASLADICATVRALPGVRGVLFSDGELPAAAAGLEHLRQPPGSLDDRVAFLADVTDGPLLAVTYDVPQLTVAHLAAVVDGRAPHDAMIGRSTDGGLWGLYLRSPRSGLVRGIRTSQSDTADRLHDRLREAGCSVGALPTLVDVDTYDDAVTVSAMIPASAFAAALRASAPIAVP